MKVWGKTKFSAKGMNLRNFILLILIILLVNLFWLVSIPLFKIGYNRIVGATYFIIAWFPILLLHIIKRFGGIYLKIKKFLSYTYIPFVVLCLLTSNSCFIYSFSSQLTIQKYLFFIFLNVAFTCLAILFIQCFVELQKIWGTGTPILFRYTYYEDYFRYENKKFFFVLSIPFAISIILNTFSTSIQLVSQILFFFFLAFISPLETVITVSIYAIIIGQLTSYLSKIYYCTPYLPPTHEPSFFLGLIVGVLISFLLINEKNIRNYKKEIFNLLKILVLMVFIIGLILFLLTANFNSFTASLYITCIMFVVAFSFATLSSITIYPIVLPIINSYIVRTLSGFSLLLLDKSVIPLFNDYGTIISTSIIFFAIFSFFTFSEYEKLNTDNQSLRVKDKLILHVITIMTISLGTFYNFINRSYEIYFIPMNYFNILDIIMRSKLIIDFNLLASGLVLSIIIGFLRFIFNTTSLAILFFNPMSLLFSYFIARNIVILLSFIMGGVLKFVIIYLLKGRNLEGRVMIMARLYVLFLSYFAGYFISLI